MLLSFQMIGNLYIFEGRTVLYLKYVTHFCTVFRGVYKAMQKKKKNSQEETEKCDGDLRPC